MEMKTLGWDCSELVRMSLHESSAASLSTSEKFGVPVYGKFPSPLSKIVAGTMPTVHLLDYVAGNVRSLVNAIEKIGFTVEWIKEPADISRAEVREYWFPLSWTISN